MLQALLRQNAEEHDRAAIQLYREEMEKRDVCLLNDSSLVLLLKAAAKCEDLRAGQQAHEHFVGRFGAHSLSSCVTASTALIDFYGRFGRLELAHALFDGVGDAQCPNCGALFNFYGSPATSIVADYEASELVM